MTAHRNAFKQWLSDESAVRRCEREIFARGRIASGWEVVRLRELRAIARQSLQDFLKEASAPDGAPPDAPEQG